MDKSPNLFPYQTVGAQWLESRRSALLADDMGLGKSAQAITACDSVLADPILVICPAVARINWQREFEKFSQFNREFAICREGKLPPAQGQNAIVSYDLLASYHARGLLKRHRWDVAIVDEGHFLKNWEAKRTRAVLGSTGIVHQATRIWALTGTPMPNHPGELWTWLYTLGATKKSYVRFIDHFCDFDTGSYDPMGKIVGVKKSRIPELQTLLGKIMLRRTGNAGLAPISVGEVYVEPGKVELPEPDLKKLRAQLSALSIKLKDLTYEQTFAMLEGLAPSVATLRRLHGLQKIEPCARLIEEELASHAYKKIVVFCVHKDVARGLANRLASFFPVVVNGDTPPAKRQDYIDRFQSSSRCQVFIGNILAAGTAITLTASNHVLFVEQDWVPANNAQAAKRCHRIGQEKPVFVRCACIYGSIDEKISGVLRRKMSDITAVFKDA